MLRIGTVLVLLCGIADAQPKRVLYVTHSAGFRHGSLPVSRQAFEQIATRTGRFEILATEDLSLLTATRLRDFDAVFFFTSGELALTSEQKRDLLDFVRAGKGFGGAHSATDTLYSWAEYGELIGGYFDGHPWVQEARIDVEDPDHPAARHLSPSWSIVEEFYQFRAFSRDRVRVLMTLDTTSVDLKLPGVNRRDEDFALAWTREYGQGRVFYTALGHFDETWRDPRFLTTIEQALLWLTRQIDAVSIPRPRPAPVLEAPLGEIAPGGVREIFGQSLTSGSTLTAPVLSWPIRLAGTRLQIGGRDARLLFASPTQVNVQFPFELAPGTEAAVTWISGDTRHPAGSVRIAEADPRILAAVDAGSAVTLYAVGLGALELPIVEGTPAPLDRLVRTARLPRAFVNGVESVIQFSGLAPGWVALYQVNAILPAGTPPRGEIELELEAAGRRARFTWLR